MAMLGSIVVGEGWLLWIVSELKAVPVAGKRFPEN